MTYPFAIYSIYSSVPFLWWKSGHSVPSRISSCAHFHNCMYLCFNQWKSVLLHCNQTTSMLQYVTYIVTGNFIRIVMIHKSRQALRHLDHVIDRQNSSWPRSLTASSRKVLQKNHVSHGYDWVSTNMIGQGPLTVPVFSQWQHAGHVPPNHPGMNRSDIGHTWYICHASSWFPEIMHRWKLEILSLSNILHQICSMTTEPPNHHPISYSEVL